LLAAIPLARAVQPPEPGPPPPDLVLVTVSSLRSDRVTTRGMSRSLTPHLDEISRDGFLLVRSRTPSPATLPALVSLLTGLDPGHHGVYGPRPPAGELTALPAILREHGFTGIAVVADDAIANIDPVLAGLDEVVVLDRQPAAEIARRAVEIVERLEPEGRLFLWVHFRDPSAPYLPVLGDLAEFMGDGWNTVWKFPLPVAREEGVPDTLPPTVLNGGIREVAFYLDSYDSAVREADRGIGALWAWLVGAGRAERTVFAVASLHGEALGDHGHWFSHGWTLYEEELAVPLLIRGPGVRPQRDAGDESWACLLDLQPTLLALLGVEGAAGSDGFNLAAVLRGSSPPPRRFMYAGLVRPPYSRVVVGELRFKLISTPPRPPFLSGPPSWGQEKQRELYDLKLDRLESIRLERSRGTIAHELDVWLRERYPPWPGTPPAEDTSRRR
jgi:hypothetical protein